MVKWVRYGQEKCVAVNNCDLLAGTSWYVKLYVQLTWQYHVRRKVCRIGWHERRCYTGHKVRKGEFAIGTKDVELNNLYNSKCKTRSVQRRNNKTPISRTARPLVGSDISQGTDPDLNDHNCFL